MASIRVCRDAVTRRSLCYGYVNYSTQLDGAFRPWPARHTGGPPCVAWPDPRLTRLFCPAPSPCCPGGVEQRRLVRGARPGTQALRQSPGPQGWWALGYCGRQAGPDAAAPPPTHAAERALQELNYSKINDKPIRLMWSLRDPNARKTTAANIFIKVRPDKTHGWPAAQVAPVLRAWRCGQAPAAVGVRLTPPPCRLGAEPGRVHRHQGPARHV